jgi:hypothetical protein
MALTVHIYWEPPLRPCVVATVQGLVIVINPQVDPDFLLAGVACDTTTKLAAAFTALAESADLVLVSDSRGMQGAALLAGAPGFRAAVYVLDGAFRIARHVMPTLPFLDPAVGICFIV